MKDVARLHAEALAFFPCQRASKVRSALHCSAGSATQGRQRPIRPEVPGRGPGSGLLSHHG
jgi:hypothetical protein